jgi:phosphate transport system protein
MNTLNRYFHTELQGIRDDLVVMAARAIEVTDWAIRGLIDGDPQLLHDVINADDSIDELDVRIDAESVRYITLRAPVASDVRLLTVAMKAAHDLERCGDEACSIAKRALRIQDRSMIDWRPFEEMSRQTIHLLREAIEAFVEEDAEKARQLPIKDKSIDDLNRDNFTRLNEWIMEDRMHSIPATQLMFISKSIERIGDHATNIAEEVYFLLRGEDIRHTNAVRHGQE